MLARRYRFTTVRDIWNDLQKVNPDFITASNFKIMKSLKKYSHMSFWKVSIWNTVEPSWEDWILKLNWILLYVSLKFLQVDFIYIDEFT